MNDLLGLAPPPVLERIQADTEAMGFLMGSGLQVGALLCTLAAAKPGASVLELGTGTGLATAWLLAGMDAAARMVSVENDATVAAVAQRHLADDRRVHFVIADAGAFLVTAAPQSVDLIFADTWAGKYTHLEETLRLLRLGGLYVIDDMLPQPNWPEGHAVKVAKLIDELAQRTDLVLTKLSWASGVIVATKIRSSSVSEEIEATL